MEQVQTELQGRVLHIILNRPEKKNALTSPMYLELVRAFEAGESDKTVRAFVLRSNGDSFSAGNDIEDFLQKPWKNDAVPPAERFIRTVANLEKPIVAAVHGSAAGIGATILLHCDLVYAADDTRFLMPFVNIGLIPEAGSTLLLPQRIGYQRAAELLLLATPYSAQRAHELGLVNHVVPVSEVVVAASSAAQTLAEKPAASIRLSKKMMKQHYRSELNQVMREEVLAIAEKLESPECHEALTAFLQKRKPDFSGFD
jgi:enoyl-CoA hydratase/carnithine racemase